jgi:hypothetical protein
MTERVKMVKAGVNLLAGHRSSHITEKVQHIEKDYENIVQRLDSTQKISVRLVSLGE